MQNTQNLKFVDPHVIQKNWYLKRGLNLFNVTKNNEENLKKKKLLYTMRYALNFPFLNAIQGFIKQYNYQDQPSWLREQNTTNVIVDAKMLHPDILYLNRRVMEQRFGRVGFQEIIIDRKKRRLDGNFRVWGMREIMERQFIEEGTHTVYGVDKESLADAPQDCLRPNKALKIFDSEEELEEAKTMLEKMKKASEDGLCRMYENGEFKVKIPIPRIRENVDCVQYGCEVYIHIMPKIERQRQQEINADNLFQQAMGIPSRSTEQQ